jgi:uncharacterized SAM-binding protein YcdF (DUF218 family)
VLVRTLVLPPGAPLLLAALGLALLRRRPTLGRRLAIAGVGLAWALSTHLVADPLTRLVEAGPGPLDAPAWDAARTGPHPPRALVILGGGAVVDGPPQDRRERLAPRSLQRVLAGARLAKTTGLPVLVSGGGTPWLRATEAALMREVLERDLGVAVRWLEDASRDTAENASGSAAMLRADGIDSIVLVTHAYHMRRSVAAFEAAGLRVLAAPHDWRGGAGAPRASDFWPSASAVELTWLAAHELAGRAWYRLLGRN